MGVPKPGPHKREAGLILGGCGTKVAPVSLNEAYLGLRTHRTTRLVVLVGYRNGNTMLTFHAPVVNRVLLLMPPNMF
jgi:hypothetical protein